MHALSNLAITESLRDQSEYLKFARRDPQCVAFGVIEFEGRGDGNGHLFNNDAFRGASQSQAEPNSESSKEGSDEPAVHLDRVLHNQPSILDRFESSDEEATKDAVKKNVFSHARNLKRGRNANTVQYRRSAAGQSPLILYGLT